MTMRTGECRVSHQSTREWAHVYARLGWRVLPVVPLEKKPLFTGWQRDATTDPRVIDQHWRSDPGPNIGLICGEAFVAYDIEAEHLAALRTWMRERDLRLPETPIASTGRGGIHILVRARGSTSGRSLRLDGVHVGELKASGGFIVACPSRTAGTYGWHRSPEKCDLADAPDWLSGLAVESRLPGEPSPTGTISPSRAVALVAGLYRVVATAPEGDRNALLYWALCRAAEHGVDRDAATEILLAAARQAGLPEREARSTIASGLWR